MTTWAGNSGSRQASRVCTATPSSASELPTRAKSLAQEALMACTTWSSCVWPMLATSLRPLMPPAALHQSVNTCAAFTRSGILVKA
jgi:hypothetical protein